MRATPLGHIASGIEKLAGSRGDVAVRFELAEKKALNPPRTCNLSPNPTRREP
jgi:hypothetical protein